MSIVLAKIDTILQRSEVLRAVRPAKLYFTNGHFSAIYLIKIKYEAKFRTYIKNQQSLLAMLIFIIIQLLKTESGNKIEKLFRTKETVKNI